MNECSVCLCSIWCFMISVKTTCGHTFHVSCIDEWARKSCKCPMCRKKLHWTWQLFYKSIIGTTTSVNPTADDLIEDQREEHRLIYERYRYEIDNLFQQQREEVRLLYEKWDSMYINRSYFDIWLGRIIIMLLIILAILWSRMFFQYMFSNTLLV